MEIVVGVVMLLVALGSVRLAYGGLRGWVERRRAARATRRHNARCPACAWNPPIRPNWVCGAGCGTKFDTFACGGVCPGCGHEQDRTACPGCGHAALRSDWLIGGKPAKPQVGRVQRAGTQLDQCPYCHDQVADPADGVACAGCLARHHAECWDAHGACSACNSNLRYGAPEESEGRAARPDAREKA